MSGEIDVSWELASTTIPEPLLVWQVLLAPHICEGGQPPHVPWQPSLPQVLLAHEGVQVGVIVVPPEPVSPPVLVAPPDPTRPPLLVAPPKPVSPPVLVTPPVLVRTPPPELT
jgi:hypothetical protein